MLPVALIFLAFCGNDRPHPAAAKVRDPHGDLLPGRLLGPLPILTASRGVLARQLGPHL